MAMSKAVANLHQIDNIVPVVQDRARQLRRGKKHYQPVDEALIWTLRPGLGEGFTLAVEGARLRAYTTLAGVMSAPAAERAAKVG
jgi:hemoglobin-like flavoprotein